MTTGLGSTLYVPPKLIIAIDPGGTTGYAAYWPVAATRIVQGTWERHEIENCELGFQLRHLLREIGSLTRTVQPFIAKPTIHIVYEPFEFRRNERERDKIEYTSAEVVGALKYWADDLDYVKLVPQPASSGMAFWDDAKIKKLGLWVPGRRHAMDATAHLLKYRSFVLGEKHLYLPFKPEALATDVVHLPE